MKTLKVLSIGNSFSEDAQRYLYLLAKTEGVSIKAENLMIGGCPLDRHFRNMYSDRKEYYLELNGERSEYFVSLKEAVLSDDWDVITLQQASHLSFIESSYEPYAKELASFIRKYSPKAKIYVHQTWAYESGSAMIRSKDFETMDEMSEKVFACYDKMVKDINADGIIKDGKAMLNLSKAVKSKVHRDGFHASLGLGRFTLACVWFETLTGVRPVKPFNFLDEEVDEKELDLARNVAHSIAIETK